MTDLSKDHLQEMLNMQDDLQAVAYGIYPSAIIKSGDMSYIRDMVLALTDELHEALNEVSWKPWTNGTPYVNRDNFKKELVDAFHFFMNLMLAVDMTSDELYQMYMKKRQVNIDRQTTGYDGVSTKCSNCNRAFEDVTLTEIELPNEILIQCMCGTQIPYDVARPFLID